METSATPLTLAAFIAFLTLLILFATFIITGMRLYASVTEKLATLMAKVDHLEKVHNGGHHDIPKGR